MNRRPSTFAKTTLLTAVIGEPKEFLEKLWWNLRNVESTFNEIDHIGDTIAYALIDYAAAAVSLENWIRKDPARKAAYKLIEIDNPIPWQNAFREITDTAKHGTHREQHWPGGRVSLELEMDDDADATWREITDPTESLRVLIDMIDDRSAWWTIELKTHGKPERTDVKSALHANFARWDSFIRQDS